MTDDLDPLRQLRPDRLQPDDPPDPETLTQERRRLMASIEGSSTDPAPPRRFPSIYPRLAYDDEAAAIEFLTRVFGFRERREARMEHPQGMLAWLEVGDGVVMIGRAGTHLHGLLSPRETGHTTAMVNVYVDEIDAHYQRAVTQGARIMIDLEDMFWGDRRYEALDPEGHRWHFAQRLSEIRDPVPAVTSPPAGFPRILPHLIYDDVGAAVDMLTTTFGFQERTSARHTAADGTIGRTQMQVADSVITLGQPSIHGDSPLRGVSSMLYIYVDDVDDHFRRAQAAGATIVTPPATQLWGDRRYQATDREGHQWTFAQPISAPDPHCH